MPKSRQPCPLALPIAASFRMPNGASTMHTPPAGRPLTAGTVTRPVAHADVDDGEQIEDAVQGTVTVRNKSWTTW